MSDYPHISVIIPVHNAKDTLTLCLTSLAELDYPSDQLEILVVDNNSRDDSRAIIGQFPVTCLEESIQTSYAARNKGVRAARGEILAFTDADCIVEKGWLKTLVKGFEDSTVGCCAGEILPYEPSSLVEVYQARQGRLSQKVTLNKDFLPFPQTANAAYRREVFDQIGMFNFKLISGGDTDFAWRMQLQTDFKIRYYPEAVVYHKHRTSVKGLFKQCARYSIGKEDLHRLYPEYEVRPLWREIQIDINATIKHAVRLPFHLCLHLLRRIDRVDLLRPWLDLVGMWGRCYGMAKCRTGIIP